MGGTPKSSILDGDFPWNQPSIWGYYKSTDKSRIHHGFTDVLNIMFPDETTAPSASIGVGAFQTTVGSTHGLFGNANEVRMVSWWFFSSQIQWIGESLRANLQETSGNHVFFFTINYIEGFPVPIFPQANPLTNRWGYEMRLSKRDGQTKSYCIWIHKELLYPLVN